MTNAVIIDCVRTPVGRSDPRRGYFRDVRGDDLALACVTALIERTGIDPSEIEDVVIGCARQSGQQGLDVARLIALMAGLPAETGGVTVNRLCGSSLQALNQAAHAVMAGSEDVQIVGGLEHMQHLPIGQDWDTNPKLFQRTTRGTLSMGLTAEFLAQKHDISRREQDQWALLSHQRASSAFADRRFQAELVPVHGRNQEGQRIQIETDQCMRADCSLEELAGLEPVFVPRQGTITAGNSSPVNDGAAALLIMSEAKAQQLGLKPLVRIRSTAVAGVEPAVMGTGPVAASNKALRRAGLTLKDIDLIELNEAFAVQVLCCGRLLGIDPERMNVNGGAIAIGHPLGASGARITTTLIHAMLDRDATLGLATMCIGFGQGIATIFERV